MSAYAKAPEQASGRVFFASSTIKTLPLPLHVAESENAGEHQRVPLLTSLRMAALYPALFIPTCW